MTFSEFNIGSEYAAQRDWKQARVHFERALQAMRQEANWQGLTLHR